MFFRNHDGYFDPTAGLALTHIAREERRAQKKAEQAAKIQQQKELSERKNMKYLLYGYFAENDCMMYINNTEWLRSWPDSDDAHYLTNEMKKLGVIHINMKKRVRTREVKGESNPWQALADAIILQAVKDYRNRACMMKKIKNRLKRDKTLAPDEVTFLEKRYAKYEEAQDDAGDFFFSDLFSVLTDLDGYDLLDRLNREANL